MAAAAALAAAGLALVWAGAVRREGPALRPASPARTETTPVRLAFWNLDWFPGGRPQAGPPERERHLAAVRAAVGRLQPDLLGLEEVADAAAAAAAVAALGAGFHVDVCTGFREPDGVRPARQQIVLASRLPLRRAGWEAWGPGVDGTPAPARGFAFAWYEPAPGRLLLVYGLHLKSNRAAGRAGGAAANRREREESSRQLLRDLSTRVAAGVAALRRPAGHDGAPAGVTVTTVFGGDLNTSLDDPRFARERTLRTWLEAGFGWVWRDVPLNARLTLPGAGRFPDNCFDHIFYRGVAFGPGEGSPRPAPPRLRAARVIVTGRECSDHRPVVATLELPGEQASASDQP